MDLAETAVGDLRESYEQAIRANPKLRIRDAADQLGVSEAELVASGADADVIRLDGPWADLMREMPSLGPVMCLTRNEHCVHERDGTFEDVSGQGPHGLVLGPDIDLRLFYSQWKYGFAVSKEVQGSVRRSLQFFDGAGTAVHKIFLRDGSDVARYEDLVHRFRMPEPAAPISVSPAEPPAPDLPDADIDADGFLGEWAALKDTHDFMTLLRKYKVGRVQALRLAEGRFAEPVEVGAFRDALERAAANGNEIMIFVGSPGCIQIHTGPVSNLKEIGPWFNVLDPKFNLHLRQDRIASAWVVRKPTEDGDVTSLEIFDADNKNIALMFGRRKPGEAELESWRELAAALPRLHRNTAA